MGAHLSYETSTLCTCPDEENVFLFAKAGVVADSHLEVNDEIYLSLPIFPDI